MIRFHAPDPTDLGPSNPLGPGDSADNDHDKAIAVIGESIDVIQVILQLKTDESSPNHLDTVFGGSVRLLGVGRIKVIEIVQQIIRLQEQDISERINELDILKIITVRVFSFFVEFIFLNPIIFCMSI